MIKFWIGLSLIVLDVVGGILGYYGFIFRGVTFLQGAIIFIVTLFIGIGLMLDDLKIDFEIREED